MGVTAPESGKPQGQALQQYGNSATFKGQKINNTPDLGSAVDLEPKNNLSEQLVMQAATATVAELSMQRKGQTPRYSPINTRWTDGIQSPDNNVFSGIRFGAVLSALRATVSMITNLGNTSVSIDGSALVATNLVLVKNGAIPSQYTAAALASTANVNLAVTLDGVTVDGVALAAGDRVLLKNQTAPEENGLYEVVATPTVAARVSDMNAVGEVVFGKGVTVTAGTVNTGKVFVVSVVPTVLDTDPLLFEDTAISQIPHAFDGLYVVGTVGGGTAALTRATTMDTAAEIAGAVVDVTSGTVNTGKKFVNLLTGGNVINVTPNQFMDWALLQPDAKNLPGDNMQNVDAVVYTKA